MAPNISTATPVSHSPLPGAPDLAKTAQAAIVDIATMAQDKARAVSQAAVDSVNQTRGAAAQALGNAASAIHDAAPGLPGGARVAGLAESAAAEINATAQYVRAHTAQQMTADLRHFVMRHPGASVVAAAVVGVLIGRGFRRH